MTKIATVNFETSMDKEANLAKMVDFIKQAGEQACDLVVLPEEALTGIGTAGFVAVSSEDKIGIHRNSELIPEGPSTQLFIELAKEYGMYICWGMAERDPERDFAYHNCAVLVGPEGYIGKYRKTHLVLTESLYHFPGTEFPVFDTALGRIGMYICYDMCFPEVARSLAIKGAELLICLTGWPNITGTEDAAGHIEYMTFQKARAAENMVPIVVSTLCGPYLEGNSMILGATAGKVIAQGGFGEEMVIAEMDPKKEVVEARMLSMGGVDLLRDRKPNLYGPLAEPGPFTPFYSCTSSVGA
ncbi:carbon-nitrogen hydrolase family protein [Ellagibacter sp.]|uniref:carbon-nitrogen hydrolase family protein n=1 Tax=Ellagibacter sp. TaxID=2137578 RepID=UPI003AB58ABD